MKVMSILSNICKHITNYLKRVKHAHIIYIYVRVLIARNTVLTKHKRCKV